MSAVEVVLPKVDMDMEDGIIAAWHVADGDVVRQGDVLFEMETNKSVMEVEAPASGRIRGLAPITGEPVAVGTPVAWIDPEGAASNVETAVVATSARVEPVAPRPREVAPEPASTAAVPQPEGSPQQGLRATPFARRTAREHGADLLDIAGSGPRGRIVAADVEAHVAARGQVDATLELFTPVRRIVAQRLAESARNIPHFYLSAQIEMTSLLEALKASAPAVRAEVGVKPSLTVLLVRIVARVLAAHPRVNASVEGEAARLHRDVNVGVAMDREGDLVVPVVRNVTTRSLAGLTREYVRLRDAVRDRTIAPSDMRGGTFTVSNLAMHGVDAFTAIINPPEAAILAIGRTVDTPVVRDGAIVVRPMATFTLSSDHRIIDGTAAARFMADLRRAIEGAAQALQ